MRTVHKIYPETEDGSFHEARSILMSLLSCQSDNDYRKLLDLIVGKLIWTYNTNILLLTN